MAKIKIIQKKVGLSFLIITVFISSYSQIIYDASTMSWHIGSGSNEYKLFLKDSSVFLDHFGPSGTLSWSDQMHAWWGYRDVPFDFSVRVNGILYTSKNFYFVSHEIHTNASGVEELSLTLLEKNKGFAAEIHYLSYKETGVIGRFVIIKNTGSEPLILNKAPSLTWKMPEASYDLTYLWGFWGNERNLQTETLRAGERTFSSKSGRSSTNFAPWFYLRNKKSGISYIADLAYSGNWEMAFRLYPCASRSDTGELEVSFGVLFDEPGYTVLKPGESFRTPEIVCTATSGDIDDASNQMRRYQRKYVFPKPSSPMLVQFNSWYPFPGNLKSDELKKCIDVAAKIGTEVFVIDAGWYNRKDWSRELGDWQADKTSFPKGLEEIERYARKKGLKFGLWVEIENLGNESNMLKNHPDWVYTCNGKQITSFYRYPLNLNKPEVRQWMKSELNRLVKTYHLDWIKIDYNIDPGICFDDMGIVPKGMVHYHNIMHYYQILDDVRAENPNLIIENCASGGLRFDNGILRHTHTNWLSDEVSPLPSLALGYGCNTQFSCEVCNHWMVGDEDNATITSHCSPEWFLFMLRVPMNGQFGISSRIFEWNPWMITMAADQIKYYKENIRPVITGSDIYHLTPQPHPKKPEGWMAIQYVSQDKKRSVVMTYRLDNSTDKNIFYIRGLNPDTQYQIFIEKKPSGIFTGRKIMNEGITVSLEKIWSSAVVEIIQVK